MVARGEVSLRKIADMLCEEVCLHASSRLWSSELFVDAFEAQRDDEDDEHEDAHDDEHDADHEAVDDNDHGHHHHDAHAHANAETDNINTMTMMKKKNIASSISSSVSMNGMKRLSPQQRELRLRRQMHRSAGCAVALPHIMCEQVDFPFATRVMPFCSAYQRVTSSNTATAAASSSLMTTAASVRDVTMKHHQPQHHEHQPQHHEHQHQTVLSVSGGLFPIAIQRVMMDICRDVLSCTTDTSNVMKETMVNGHHLQRDDEDDGDHDDDAVNRYVVDVRTAERNGLHQYHRHRHVQSGGDAAVDAYVDTVLPSRSDMTMTMTMTNSTRQHHRHHAQLLKNPSTVTSK